MDGILGPVCMIKNTFDRRSCLRKNTVLPARWGVTSRRSRQIFPRIHRLAVAEHAEVKVGSGALPCVA